MAEDITTSNECLPPCPVADGRIGLFCTCGNVVKRWEATVKLLRGDNPDDK